LKNCKKGEHSSLFARSEEGKTNPKKKKKGKREGFINLLTLSWFSFF